MKQRAWRLTPLLLLALLLFILNGAFAITPQQKVIDDKKQKDASSAAAVAKAAMASTQQNSPKDGEWTKPRESYGPGEHAFFEASTILHRIKPASNRLAQYRKPQGVLGTTAYYAKELFFLLFMNGPPQHDLLPTRTHSEKLSQPLSEAVKFLEEAAAEGNADATFTLAEMNFYGNYSHPRNYPEAYRRYQDLADLNGNSSAQYMLGFMYATGIGSAVKQDQAKSLLYHTFAAEAGDIRSQMTVAFRHHTGISAARACEDAVRWYKKVADRAMAYIRSGPPGGHNLVKDAFRIADEEGGVYGEGASVSSAGPNAKQGGPTYDTHAAFDDVLEYLDLMHRKGDLKATFNLAKLHYDGSRGFERDYAQAKRFFLSVARKAWTKDGRPIDDISPGEEKLASLAAGYLGRMFLRGEGMEQSFSIAKTWFRRGISNGDSLCQYSMGLMYLYGLGVEKDAVKASELFGAAADQDFASAQVRIGALFLDQGDVATAIRYFELAARKGQVEAYYFLAEISNQGIGRDKSCGMAAVYYKLVAENAEPILSAFEEANAAYENGDLETALVDYMMAAEQGFEIGQANVAYLLDHAKPRFNLASIVPFMKRKIAVMSDAALALIYWTRSAKQQNIDSMVKMGDYYLSGFGTVQDSEKAAACYQTAAETMQAAQAMWNLGWMHENGVGMEQDFHLAKRFYDQALETNREAYLPVTLALTKLRARSWWNKVTNGNVKSIQDEPVPRQKFSLADWIQNFLDADAAYYADLEPDDWDDTGAGWAGDDYYLDDIDEGMIETILIVGIAAAIAALVYYRQERQRQHRRQQEEQQRQNGGIVPAADGGAVGGGGQNDAGVFPPPGDPAWNDWVAGGVGH